jgi:integrase/recombinase XerC
MFIDRFISYLQFEKRFSRHTVVAYHQDLRQYNEYLICNELELNEVKHSHLRSWMVELLDAGSEARTIHRKLSTLRSYYKFLVREGLVAQNPALEIKPPKIPKRLPVVIAADDLNRLLDDKNIGFNPTPTFSEDFAGLQERLIIELLFGTGIRLSELAALKEEDVNSYESSIKVLGKRNKERIIPVNSTLIELIKQFISAKKSQKLCNISTSLIVTKEGKAIYPQFIYRVVKKCLSIISTHNKRSPHVLRHSFATSLLNNGADINAIKELLGHASLAATQVYTHNSVERLKSIYKQAHPKA